MPEKLLFFVYRRPELSRAEFCRRYLEEHAPLVLRHCPNLRRYVLNIVEDPEEKSPDAFDAAVELWYGSVEDWDDQSRRYDSPDGRAAVEESRAALIRSSVGYQVKPTTHREYDRTWRKGERSPGYKTVVPLMRKDGLSHEQFVDHWLHTHAPLALQHVLGIGRYVTNVVLAPLTPDAPEVDGIVEVHYTGERRFDSPEGQAIMMEDVGKFLSPPSRNRAGEYVLRS